MAGLDSSMLRMHSKTSWLRTCVLAAAALGACGGQSHRTPPATARPSQATIARPSQAPPVAAYRKPYDCMTLVSDGDSDEVWAAALALPEGRLDRLIRISVPDESAVGSDISSLGRIGGNLYFCDETLHSAALENGATRDLGVPCEGVAAHTGGLVILPEIGSLEAMPDPDRPAARTPLNVAPYASRLAIAGDRIYAAWHSTDAVLVYSMSGQQELPGISLVGYDTWINGMAATSDGRLILSAVWPERRVVVFDPRSGKPVYQVDVADDFPTPMGLVCQPRE